MSEGIKAQYAVLVELRRVEVKVAHLQAEAERIPQELATIDSAIGTRRETYLKQKEETDAAEKNLRKVEQDLRAKEDQLNKAESKMMEVKTNEEYQAAGKENQTQKDEKSKLEDQTLVLITQLEERRSKLKAAETEFKTYETTLSQDKDRLESERQKVLKLIEEQTIIRSAVVAKLDRHIADIYQRALKRIKGVPIVFAENCTCTACNMRLRPQLFNEILGQKVLHTCPSCGKILITPSQDSAADPAEVEAQ